LRLFAGAAVSARIVTLPRFLVALAALVFVQLLNAQVGVGDKRDDVLRLLGRPVSRAQRGEREIFLYPHGGRIEFLNGAVADVKGPLPAPVAASPAPVSNEAATAAQQTVAPTPVLPPKPLITPKPSPGAQQATAPSDNPAIAAEALGREVEKMDTAWGARPKIPMQPPQFNWLKLLVTVVLHFGVTLLGLRIAFKIEEMDSFWSGTFAIAGIDLAVYALLEGLGPVTGGISSMGGVESGIGALVMVGTIQKFCFNKRLQNAVITAMSVKFVVQLCHIFIFVLLLNALFG
jgi:hypothetical protein